MWKISQNKLKFLPLIFLFLVTSIFFYQTFVFGKIPFPGDLLLSGYTPWRHQSYQGYVMGAIPSKDQYFDVIRELYPWKTLVINEIKKSNIPLWNPYNFSGSPLLANYQSQVFYPLSILYFIFPQVIAWTILIILQPLLGSIFMYLFASEIGLSVSAAIVSAVLFNFSSFASTWIEFNTVWQTILWLPLLLFLLEKAVKNYGFTIPSKILMIFGIFSSISAGHPQDFLNTFFYFIIYALIRIFTYVQWDRKKQIHFILVELFPLVIFPFLLASIQLFPTLELFRNSARVPHDYVSIISSMLVQWWQLPMVIFQDFFGNPATKTNIIGDYVNKSLSIGVTGFFLSIIGIMYAKKSFHKQYFMYAAGIILFLVTNSPITKILYHIPIPIMSTGTPTRNLFLFLFSLSLLAGYGFTYLQTGKNIKNGIVLFVTILISLGIFAILSPKLVPPLMVINAAGVLKKSFIIILALSVVILLITAILRRHNKSILYFLVVLCVIELFYGFQKFNPFVPSSFVFPKNALIEFLQSHSGINRFWGYGVSGVEANFATQTNIYSPDGTDPMNLSWYNEFIQSSKNGSVPETFNRKTRSDAQIHPGYGENDLPENLYRLRILDILGVKYLVNRTENPISEKTFPIDRYSIAWEYGGWTVYENKNAAPRYFLTTLYETYSSKIDFEKKIFTPQFNSKTILIKAQDNKNIPPLSGSLHDIKLRTYSPSKIVFETLTDGNQLLFLSDTFDYGWKVYINNKPSIIIPADWTFRSVIIPPGKSTIIFRYEPNSFKFGFFVSSGSMAVIFFYLLYSIFHKKNGGIENTKNN